MNELQRLYISDWRSKTRVVEDEILVHNIFVYNIPKKVTQEETLEYFSQFGKVTRVHLVPNKKTTRRNAPKFGFINFFDPTAAKKALDRPIHLIQSKRVKVKPCDRWHQPNISLYKSNFTEDNKTTPNNTQTSQPLIFMLNDDCLEHIFKQLQIYEQVQLSRVCRRFREVFKMFAKIEHRTHDFEKLSSLRLLSEKREFYRTAGHSIEELKGSQLCTDPERVVSFISNFCPNIKIITFYSIHVKSVVLKKLLNQLSNVTVLKLADCSLHDNAILALKKLPKLKTLLLCHNKKITGKYIDLLKSVEELILYGCENIKPVYFADICKSLKGLQSLDIQLCPLLENSLCEIVTNCTSLKLLKIQTWNNCKCVARLPAITKLEVLCLSNILMIELLKELGEQKNCQLEHLKIVVGHSSLDNRHFVQIARLTNLKEFIYSSIDNLSFILTDDDLRKLCGLQNLEEIVLRQCLYITNDGLLELLSRCTKLKKVKLGKCFGITDQFILKVAKLFKTTESQRSKGACILNIISAKINRFALNNSDYLAAESLIKIKLSSIWTDDPEDKLYIARPRLKQLRCRTARYYRRHRWSSSEDDEFPYERW